VLRTLATIEKTRAAVFGIDAGEEPKPESFRALDSLDLEVADQHLPGAIQTVDLYSHPGQHLWVLDNQQLFIGSGVVEARAERRGTH